ncbi:hypothetical protein [Actinomyces radicidentis]|uniref:hypothetical protein n=1 Tax=Actinomyces radicidentis TaxID=111015 RepID=UPI0026E0DB82|nr:hypothetical protein [Actinomyces radicidentis]
MDDDAARPLVPRAPVRRARLTSAGLAALSTGTPLVLAAVSDRLVAVAQDHNRSGAWLLLAATVVLVALSLVLSVLVQARAERHRQDVLVDAQTTATERMLGLARTAAGGTVKERLVDDLADVVTLRVQTLPQLAVTAVAALVSLVWVARISPYALAWAVVGSLATTLPAWAVKRSAERAYEDTTDVEAATTPSTSRPARTSTSSAPSASRTTCAPACAASTTSTCASAPSPRPPVPPSGACPTSCRPPPCTDPSSSSSGSSRPGAARSYAPGRSSTAS